MVQKRSEFIFWVVCTLADKESDIKLPDFAVEFSVMCVLEHKEKREEEKEKERKWHISGLKLRQLPL